MTTGAIMDITKVKQLLHQREPYLMVDKVLTLSDTEIEVEKNHRGDEAHLQGHFPGAPVVPGAMLQEICTQGAGILLTEYFSPVENYHSDQTKGHALGVLRKVSQAKFKSIVKPNRPIQAKVALIQQMDNLFEFKAKVYQDQSVKAHFEFTLANVSDEVLY